MASPSRDQLEARLRKRLSAFLNRSRPWRPVLDVIEKAADRRGWRPLLFGGTLRDLLIEGCPPPRDLDFVVPGASLDELREELGGHVERRTRFGGLRLRIRALPVDIWPLEQTWAFARGLVADPTPEALPRTTFLSAEAAAIELWPGRGRKRTLYTNGLFESFASSCLEINLEQNPYPELCVVRSLLTLRKLGFSAGPNLARYLVEHGAHLSPRQLVDAQLAHYGNVLLAPATLLADLACIRRQQEEGRATVRLAQGAQRKLPCPTSSGANLAEEPGRR